jgi:hypothetical protein
VVEAGDDPAWADPNFDDSKWLPVDAKTRLGEYFPKNNPAIVWQRIHVKIDARADSPQLALRAYEVSRAFEVYVNGQKLIQSGQVEPYAAALMNARLMARIPEAQLGTGSLVIAVRLRAPLTKWTSALPGFKSGMLMLGDESALRDRNLLSVIGENAATALEELLALGVGLVALALFLSQRQRLEYFWIFMQGVLNAAFLPLLVLSLARNVPVSLWIVNEAIQFGIWLTIVLMVQAFLRRPFGWFLWMCIVVACLIANVCDVGYDYGIFRASYEAFFNMPIGIVFAVVIPVLLFRQLRRGDREAGILLIPFLFYSLWIYTMIGLGLMAQVPPLRSAAVRAGLAVNAIHLGMVTFSLADLGSLSFLFWRARWRLRARCSR